MKTLLAILFLLFPFTAGADVYIPPNGNYAGSCTIPDNSSLTSISSFSTSDQISTQTACMFSGLGFEGFTIVTGGFQYGYITFDSPVSNLEYLFDYSPGDWFFGSGDIDFLASANPNGEAFVAGEVSSIWWLGCLNGQNYNGIISLEFSDSSPAAPLSASVPEPGTWMMVVSGILFVLYFALRRKSKRGGTYLIFLTFLTLSSAAWAGPPTKVKVQIVTNDTRDVRERAPGLVGLIAGSHTTEVLFGVKAIINDLHVQLTCDEGHKQCSPLGEGQTYTGELKGNSIWITQSIPLTGKVVRDHYKIKGSW